MVKSIPKRIKSAIRLILFLLNVFYTEFKKKYWNQFFPKKPNVINLNATDICNSHCIMCNIWKREKEFEFSPDQLKTILLNPLFSKVQHVGITGGEPSLRTDLPQLFETVITTLPKIVGVSMITNGIEEELIFNQIIEIDWICKQYGKSFSVMISLDGFEHTHDLVRGTNGNFVSSVRLIKRIKNETKINLSVGCTITKTNVWKVDRLLDYLKENDIYGRFRIAEYIKRLYNDLNKSAIRNFDEDEIYHLRLFFHKLKYTFEKDSTIQRTYQNIINMLGGQKRQIGCPYHTDGIVLNAKGEIAYCAPKSKVIGNTLDVSALKLWTSNLSERRRVIKEDCQQCIHDYHAPITSNEYIDEVFVKFSNTLLTNHYKKVIVIQKILNLFSRTQNNNYTIFIVGWYGTETVGDKAILGGIINEYKTKYGSDLNVIIGSLIPFVTERTVLELGINAKVVNSTTLDLIKYSSIADETIMGGGPLMDLEELYVPHIAFFTAKYFKKKTTIFGCGLGPIMTKIELVQRILKLSTTIKVRDTKSKEIAEEWTNRSDIEMFGDPAKKYLDLVSQKVKLTPINELACFLREWTKEYAPELTQEEFEIKRDKLELSLAETIKNLVSENNIQQVKLYHMHNFHVGNDDRDFSRRFIKKYFISDNRVSFDERLSTIETIVTAMKNSKINLCMRFHSVLFAHSLNTNFRVIDYTLGGKIYKYLSDNNSIDHIVKLENFSNEDITHKHIR